MERRGISTTAAVILSLLIGIAIGSGVVYLSEGTYSQTGPVESENQVESTGPEYRLKPGHNITLHGTTFYYAGVEYADSPYYNIRIGVVTPHGILLITYETPKGEVITVGDKLHTDLKLKIVSFNNDELVFEDHTPPEKGKW